MVDGENLRNLGGDAENTGASLEVAKHLHVQHALGKECAGCGSQRRDKDGSQGSSAAVVEDQDRNDDVLAHDEGRLSIGAKRELVAHIVGERNEVCGRLEEVGQKRDAGGGLRVDQLQDLRHLDNGRGANDANAEALADGELQALGVFNIDIEQDGLVALFADDGGAEVADWAGQVVGDGLNG